MPTYHTRLGHAHLKVRDLNRSITFYTRCFDLKVIELVAGQYAFLSGGDLHHEIALQALGADASNPNPYGVGLYHVAFEVPDKRTFAQAYQLLRGDGVDVAAVDHLISWAMYFDDPDGNGLEIYCDTRGEPDGAALWHGTNRRLPDTVILAALE